MAMSSLYKLEFFISCTLYSPNACFPSPTSTLQQPSSLPIVHPMVLHIPEGHLILIGTRAGEYRSPNMLLFMALTCIHTGYLLTHCRGHPHHPRKCLPLIQRLYLILEQRYVLHLPPWMPSQWETQTLW